MELISRLLAIEVSALCDADKSIRVLDPSIRAMVPDVRFAGPALTVVAADDHLPVFSALDAAVAGDVLVIKGERLAVLGELFATEAARRELAGVVIDGYCRDVAGLRKVGLPVFARGTLPASGSTVSRSTLNQPLVVGGLSVTPGDIVFGDDDGVVIASAAVISAALSGAEAIGRAERAILSSGESLHAQTNWAEHVAALDRGESSSLRFEPHG